jgi:hypothetical protein
MGNLEENMGKRVEQVKMIVLRLDDMENGSGMNREARPSVKNAEKFIVSSCYLAQSVKS